MGKNKLTVRYIENYKSRTGQFKRRRVIVLRKAMELSILTGCQIHLKIFNSGDSSMVEYCSGPKDQARQNKQ